MCNLAAWEQAGIGNRPMAKKSSFSTPVIPKKPGYCEIRRIKRAGRKDARKNQGVKDFTRTQAINEFESFSNRGEIALNDSNSFI